MKALKLAGIPALLVLCAGMAVGQDAAHDVDKAATKTGQAVKHGVKKVAKGTKTGVKDVGHGTKVAAKDTGKVSRPVQRKQEKASRMQSPSDRIPDTGDPVSSTQLAGFFEFKVPLDPGS